MNANEFLDQVKHAILEVEPSATVILYGSRARGDARSESDWDFLILVDGQVDRDREDRIRDRLYDVELSSDEVLSSTIRSHEGWEGPLCKGGPFYDEIQRDAVLL